MPYIPPEVVEQARQIDLLTYLRKLEPDNVEEVKGTRNVYRTVDHDSLKMSNGKWFWWSQGFGGYNALDYLIKVRNYSFMDAVEILTGKELANWTPPPKKEEKTEPKVLRLPEKYQDSKRVIQYLFNRGIDYHIIQECIADGVIFESNGRYHNAVFVGKDETGTPKYAAYRGLGSSTFKGDAYGSDKQYSFRLLAKEPCQSVHLFEAAIDLLSYHGYLSFKENEVTPEQAQQIGMEFATKMWGKRFQVVVTTHLNTKHLHCHFVINSVSFADGKRLKDKEKSWYYFRHIADEICLEHKLSIVEKPELHRSPAYLTMKDEAGMPTRYNNAKKAIDEAIAMSRNLRQFQYELGVMGYHSNFSPNRKYATVTPKGSEKPIRTYRLGEEYTKEKILERLIANRDNIVFKPFQPKTYIVRQYRLPTREHKIQKVGGLYGLYLYYCYRLGYLPKHNQKQQNTARLHYLLKDDLMKMDELTKQVTLLGKHQIGTDEQLFSYKRSVEDEIKTLTADRTHLRNEIRKVDISDEWLSAAKMKISAISERLKELRKEVKLCDGIAKRSGVIADTLSQVKAEEEKSQRKESRNYEQRR